MQKIKHETEFIKYAFADDAPNKLRAQARGQEAERLLDETLWVLLERHRIERIRACRDAAKAP